MSAPNERDDARFVIGVWDTSQVGHFRYPAQSVESQIFRTERAALDEASKRVMRAKKGELTIYQLVPVKRVRAPEYYDAIVLDAPAAGEGPQDRLDLGGGA